MSAELPPVQDFSDWKGWTFFEGAPAQGRVAYLVRTNESGAFLAYGVVESLQAVVFRVRGNDSDELDRFLTEMKSEGATVTWGMPPFETQTGGDKPPAQSGTPTGVKQSGTPTSVKQGSTPLRQ